MLRSALVLAIFVSTRALALEIRPGLNEDDRSQVTRTLGINSAEKILSNPYPLGGYSGFEVGLDFELIDARDLAHLGCSPSTPATVACPAYAEASDWRFSRLSVGKGLYDNVDVFFSFLLPIGGIRASDYGGTLRWSFYQAEFLPINISVLVAASQLNYGDRFMARDLGAELIAGVNVDNFSMYFGGGLTQATGTFTACTPADDGDTCAVNPTDPQVNALTRTVTNQVRQVHSVIGFSLHYESLFAAAQVDRYADAVYSAKLGLRF